jgi:hypothetical protein
MTASGNMPRRFAGELVLEGRASEQRRGIRVVDSAGIGPQTSVDAQKRSAFLAHGALLPEEIVHVNIHGVHRADLRAKTASGTLLAVEKDQP